MTANSSVPIAKAIYAVVILPRKLERSNIIAITNRNRPFQNETTVANNIISRTPSA
jgi:hypothetical protein